MNEDLNDVHRTVQHNEFTEVQGDHRDPLVSHRGQRRKRAIDRLVVVPHLFLSKANPRVARADLVVTELFTETESLTVNMRNRCLIVCYGVLCIN
jgi:hypothetical protein